MGLGFERTSVHLSRPLFFCGQKGGCSLFSPLLTLPRNFQGVWKNFSRMRFTIAKKKKNVALINIKC